MRSSICQIAAVLLITLWVIGNSFAFATQNTIEILVNQERGPVNPHVLGNNLLGYDPKSYEKNYRWDYYGYSDYGAGIWDPRRQQEVSSVVDLLKNAGVSVARFPGGSGVHHYDWKSAIGPQRQHFLFGIDEFLRVCRALNAQPVMTVSYFTGTSQDAADLVEYMNGPLSDEPSQWVKERIRNGNRDPWQVKYFEIGNETYAGDARQIKSVAPDVYARRYLEYYGKMKAVDPSIHIGAVLYLPDWNEMVLSLIREKIDFGVIHLYPSPIVSTKKLQAMTPQEIFKITMAMPEILHRIDLQKIRRLLKEKTGREVPVAVTEFNGGFVQDEPVPYRHSLGTALTIAELIKLFMEPENQVLFANYWNAANEYWGMIANGFDGTAQTLYRPFYKRPNYYVFEIYHNHFGAELIETRVRSAGYSLNTYLSFKTLVPWIKNYGARDIPYLSVNASKSADGQKVFLMVVNRNLDEPVTARIELMDFVAAGQGHAWVLNGPDIDSTNERDHDCIKVTPQNFSIPANSFEFAFEPHSLTAIEINRQGS